MLVLLDESSNFLIIFYFPSVLLFALLSGRLHQFNAPHVNLSHF